MATTTFKIFQANIQSLHKNKAELQRILTGSNYTAAVLSETWTSKQLENSNRYNITNFHFIPESRYDDRGGSGIFLSSNMNYQKIPMPITSKDTQVVTIRIIQFDLILSSIYICPSITVEDYEEDIKKIFATLENYKKVIIGGDFNSHHFAWGDRNCDAKGKILLESIDSSRFLMLNDGTHTYIPIQLGARSTAIDITLCSAEILGDAEWKVLDFGVGGSHHMGIEVILSRAIKSKSGYFIDKKRVFEEVSLIKESEVKNIENLAESVKRILKRNRKKDTKEPKYWWSATVDEAWKEKVAARREFNRKSSIDNLLLFKKKSAIFQRKKREEVKKKFDELPDEVGPFTDYKELWQKVGRLTGKRVRKRENNPMIEDEKLAQDFLDVHFGKHDPRPSEVPMCIATDNLLTWENWTRILGSKRKTSAPGEDHLTYEILGKVRPEVACRLIDQVNGMWRRSMLDDSLKNIKVVAIPKPGRDQTLPTGKRPISLVPTVTKIANTAVLERLQDFLEVKDVLPKTTFGFRKKMSTNTCVSFVVNWVKQCKRENYVTGMICIDLTNAFNAVQADKLEQILLNIGVSPDVLSWILSFLRNRQIVLHLQDKNITRTVNNGLPQGDVLSPTLFNVYTMELHTIVKNGVVLVQYADDFGILVKARNVEKLNEIAQEYIEEFTAIAEELNFQINAAKTKTLLFQNSNNHLNVQINGVAVESVKEHKYLGVTLDRYLSFGVHLKEVRTKVQERLNMVKVLSGIKNGTHPETMVRIYKALFRSIMEYGCTVHNNAALTNRKILSVLNNQCLRKVTGASKSTPLNALAALSGQEPIDLRQEYVTAKEIARCVSRDNIVAEQLQEVHLPDDTEGWYKFSYMERVYWNNRDTLSKITPIEKLATEIEVEICPFLEGLTTSKENTNPMRLKQMTLFAMNGKYRGRGKIFTDASKKGRACGIGIYIESTKERSIHRLENETSITSAELIAIQQAVRLVNMMELQHYVIYTDSRSSCIMLEEAQDSREGEAILVEILTTCWKWKTGIQWIPSHVNIEGNHIADDLAKIAVNSENVLRNNLQLTDALHHFKDRLLQKTMEWYTAYSVDKGHTFNRFQSSFSYTPWYFGTEMAGKDIRLLNRLITGHDYSKAWLARMRLADDPLCDLCLEPETSEHVILHCPQFGIGRMKYGFDNKFRTLPEAFNTRDIEVYKEIVQFVRENKLNY